MVLQALQVQVTVSNFVGERNGKMSLCKSRVILNVFAEVCFPRTAFLGKLSA